MKKLLALLFCLISLSGLAEGTLAAWGAHALYVQGSTLWAWGSNHMGESDPASRQAAVTLPVKLMENAVSTTTRMTCASALVSLCPCPFIYDSF